MKPSLWLGAASLLWGIGTLTADPVVLSVASSPNAPEILRILERERTALAELGFTLSVVSHPGERSLIEANAGRTDGDAARIDSDEIPKKFPNLERVPVAVGALTARAYTKRPLPITGLANLVAPGRKIATNSGIVWAMTVIKGMTAPEDFTAVTDYTQAFRMLAADRVDVVIAVEQSVDELLKAPEYASIRPGIFLASQPVYLFLNRRWGALIPEISAKLKSVRP